MATFSEEFWDSPFADRIAHPAPIRALLLSVQHEENLLYDLLFYSSFAKRIYDVMRREGKDVQGFDRMQQSFSESVQNVRKVLDQLVSRGFQEGRRYMEMSQEGMQKLLMLIEDLAVVNDWKLSRQGASGAGREG